MRLATYLHPSTLSPRVAAVHAFGTEDWLLDVTTSRASFERDRTTTDRAVRLAEAVAPPSMKGLIEGGERSLEAIREGVDHVLRRHAGEPTDIPWAIRADDAHFLPPVLEPATVMCQGANYRAHIEEMDHADRQIGIGDGDPRPFGFVKIPSALIGHNQPVAYPKRTAAFDYEGELAVVIGRAGYDMSESQARASIFGFTCFNDMAIRDVQNEELAIGELILGKNFPGSAPIGPWIVTADEVGPDEGRRLTLRVDGDLRQDESTANMTLSPVELVSYWSRMGFRPGDVLSTGSPAGVGAFLENGLLRPGQVCELEIEGIGVLRTPVVAAHEQDRASATPVGAAHLPI